MDMVSRIRPVVAPVMTRSWFRKALKKVGFSHVGVVEYGELQGFLGFLLLFIIAIVVFISIVVAAIAIVVVLFYSYL